MTLSEATAPSPSGARSTDCGSHHRGPGGGGGGGLQTSRSEAGPCRAGPETRAGQPGRHGPPTSDLGPPRSPVRTLGTARRGPLRPSYRADPASRATRSGRRLRGRSRGRGGAAVTAGDRGGGDGGGGRGGGGGGARSAGRHTGVRRLRHLSREREVRTGSQWNPSREGAGRAVTGRRDLDFRSCASLALPAVPWLYGLARESKGLCPSCARWLLRGRLRTEC